LSVALGAPRARATHENHTKVARVPTYTPKASEIQRAWHVVDAEGMVLGRLATEVARVLRGKHKPTFAPHLDTGDHVIVVNADKVVLTSDKADRKVVYRHSGYPGGIKAETYGRLLARRPTEAVRRSIRGMIPKTRLGRQQLTKLKVYAGPTHPHAAQKPQPLDVAHARRPTA
jgi:large subunit ribosomal protein L13